MKKTLGDFYQPRAAWSDDGSVPSFFLGTIYSWFCKHEIPKLEKNYTFFNLFEFSDFWEILKFLRIFENMKIYPPNHPDHPDPLTTLTTQTTETSLTTLSSFKTWFKTSWKSVENQLKIS